MSSSSPGSPRRPGSKSTGSTGSAASLLRSLRESQGRSLRVVAEDLGVAASQLSRIERGQRGLGEGLPERIADYYGVSADVVALAEGRVPEDVLLILAEHPDELERLRAKYQEKPVDGQGGVDQRHGEPDE
ncbi:helix-turn-helix domain-containing protein [Jiangella gansuensis]|uniref:helix-turn-helix domain-containing protein n=1 Tax=Jiangella gansuensis TaxID=281473 RepID=UPI000A027588|nr:helix-turn-helix transcriptional regulator [Jiangella gansuensis]